MELMNCPSMAVPNDVMQHVVHVESAYNPYAIGVVGARLARQPGNLAEALATVRFLEARGYNFSIGLAQVNRHNLSRYGLSSYERAFETCPNLLAGSRILAECYARSGRDWGKSFSCYYSGNFTTGFHHGYVQKIFASMRGSKRTERLVAPIGVIDGSLRQLATPSKAADVRATQRLATQVHGLSAGQQVDTEVSNSKTEKRTELVAVPQIRNPPPRGSEIGEVAMPELKPVPSDHAFVF